MPYRPAVAIPALRLRFEGKLYSDLQADAAARKAKQRRRQLLAELAQTLVKTTDSHERWAHETGPPR